MERTGQVHHSGGKTTVTLQWNRLKHDRPADQNEGRQCSSQFCRSSICIIDSKENFQRTISTYTHVHALKVMKRYLSLSLFANIHINALLSAMRPRQSSEACAGSSHWSRLKLSRIPFLIKIHRLVLQLHALRLRLLSSSSSLALIDQTLSLQATSTAASTIAGAACEAVFLRGRTFILADAASRAGIGGVRSRCAARGGAVDATAVKVTLVIEVRG